MTLDCIWWWDSSLEDLGGVEYSFIGITSRSSVTRSCGTFSAPYIHRIDCFKIIGLYAKKREEIGLFAKKKKKYWTVRKKILRKNLTKNKESNGCYFDWF